MALCTMANFTIGILLIMTEQYVKINEEKTISGLYGGEVDRFLVHKNQRQFKSLKNNLILIQNQSKCN